MLTLDQPQLPDVPRFHRDMQAFLRETGRSRRAHQRRARRRHLALAAAAAAVIATVVFGVVHAVGSGGPAGGQPPGPPEVASFSVTTGANGLVTLRLSPGQLRNPNALHLALAHARVPALVTAHSVCSAPGANALLPQVLPGPHRAVNGRAVWTIDPAAIPAGVELSIGYYQVSGGFGIHVGLVPEHGPLTCSATPPAPPQG